MIQSVVRQIIGDHWAGAAVLHIPQVDLCHLPGFWLIVEHNPDNLPYIIFGCYVHRFRK